MWIKIISIMLLGLIFLQDIKARSVYWFMFPLLAVAFLILRLGVQPLSEIFQEVLINLTFLSLQLLLVWLWCSFRRGGWINMTNALLGWGDVLFLVAAAFGLSVVNFLLFYISSLALVISCWVVFLTIIPKKADKQVPLAGLQALILVCVLACDWWWLHLDVTDDAWILNILQI